MAVIPSSANCLDTVAFASTSLNADSLVRDLEKS